MRSIGASTKCGLRSTAKGSDMASSSGEQVLQFVERLRPAARVPGLRCLVEQLLVQQGEQRGVLAIRLKRQRDLGLPIRQRDPAPREHEFAVAHELEVGAADVMALA